MIDLSKIPPLSEVEADAIFNQPNARKVALQVLGELSDEQSTKILNYIALLHKRIDRLKVQLHKEQTAYQRGYRDNY